MLKNIQKILTDSCILFTILVFIVYGIGYCIPDQSVTIAINGAAMLFGICIVLCIFRKILHVKKVPILVRALIHYLLVLFTAFLAFAVIGKIVSNSLQSLAMLAIVTLLYSVFALVYAYIESKQDNKNQEEYTSMFRK